MTFSLRRLLILTAALSPVVIIAEPQPLPQIEPKAYADAPPARSAQAFGTHPPDPIWRVPNSARAARRSLSFFAAMPKDLSQDFRQSCLLPFAVLPGIICS